MVQPIEIYQTQDGQTQVEVRFEQEMVWLSQAQMAQLFDTSADSISLHLKNIFAENELNEKSTTEDFSVVRLEGSRRVSRRLTYYNLDMIISVGYRVKSLIATRFRIWATQRLKEYMIKGFVMDDERLKNPPIKGSLIPDYFDEMLARIRDIRSSERRMYLRVKEIFAMAADYEPSWGETTRFFSVIQNKLHFAATGMTAAEIIHSRSSHQAPNMGLTTWKGAEVRKSDVTIAKNYLKEDEITGLNRIVTMWLDFAEDQAIRRKQVFMRDWEQRLDEFLQFNDRNVLTCAGTISKQQAEDHATSEYEKFEVRRRQYKESLAEADYLRLLEDAARYLPDPDNNVKKKV